MAASKDIKKYSSTMFDLYIMLSKRTEPFDAPFESKNMATSFRFKCYNFKNALEFAVKKMTAEERSLDINGYVKLLEVARRWKIKLEGKNLRFVIAIADRSDSEMQMAQLLNALPAIAPETQAKGLEVFDEVPDLDDLEAMLSQGKE